MKNRSNVVRVYWYCAHYSSFIKTLSVSHIRSPRIKTTWLRTVRKFLSVIQSLRAARSGCFRHFFTDKFWFHLSVHVNSKNFQVRGSKNPHTFLESSLHPQKIGIWCVVSWRRVIGLFFFPEIVNAACYRQILELFITTLEPQECFCWFQQDGATTHTATETIASHANYSETEWLLAQTGCLGISIWHLLNFSSGGMSKTRFSTIL